MLISSKFGAGMALLTAVTIGLTGCSSSGSKAPAASTTPSTSAVSTTPAAAPTSSAPAPVATTSAAGGTAADAATTAAVTKAYTTFFGGTKVQSVLVADLQNGTKLTAALAQEAKNPTAAGLTATVSKVTLENPSVADVTFTLLSKGSPLLTNTPGKAVKVNGTWQLAATTFCGLVAASGTVPAACNVASNTALPTS